MATMASAPTTNGGGGALAAAVNKKKAKRRAKEQAKKERERAAFLDQQHATSSGNGLPLDKDIAYDDADYPEGSYSYDAGDADGTYFSDSAQAEYGSPNGHLYSYEYTSPQGAGKTRKKGKKRSAGASGLNGTSHHTHSRHQHSSSPLMSSLAGTVAQPPHRSNARGDPIWNTSTQQERERIREFWLNLDENERKNLVKIEKEAVLRKMKEQQKHSCSCSVCGRKRTAIEEELEVLYDAYYEELEQYAYHWHEHDNGVSGLFASQEDTYSLLGRLPPDHRPPLLNPHQPTADRLRELRGQDYDDEEDDEDEDDELYDSQDVEDYSDGTEEDEEPLDIPRGPAAEFFNFGNSLTVKGGILTVADDLLKNDGKKFIEMMEQLAERRMQREEEAHYQATAGMHHHHHHPSDGYADDKGLPEDEEPYDDEEEDEYDSQDAYEDEEEDDEMEAMTEQQRMEEGRRMFQIFAARMFEQRVLSAYKDQVAKERQQKLLEELDEEENRKKEQEMRKTLNAQKKKDKKQQQKQAKAEEKAKKEAEKAAEDAAARAAEEQRQEELRKKREEQRKKKDAERKAQEEEKQRKEAERSKRQQEERERQLEAERKNRDLKAAEKKAKDDAKRKEREEREAREKEAREKKAHEDKMRRDAAEAKARSEREAREKASGATNGPANAGKRAPVSTVVALPPALQKQPSSISSPAVPIATPAVPKAPTPSKRQNSQQGSHGSSPQTPQIQPGLIKHSSPPNSATKQNNPIMPKTILARPPSGQQTAPPMHQPQQLPHMPSMISPSSIGVPPGLYNPPPPGLNGISRPQNQTLHMTQQPPINMFSNMPQQHPPPVGAPYRNFSAPNGPLPPPGMNGLGNMPPMGRGFPDIPPGFNGPLPGLAGANQSAPFGIGRENIPTHSRQQSGSGSFEAPAPIGAGQPSQRPPAPIQRPSSVKPHDGSPAKRYNDSEFEDLSSHLGSSALIDADDQILTSADRRQSGPPGISNRGGFPFSQNHQPFGMSSGSTPSSTWGTPTVPFGPSPGMPNAPTWGTLPASNLGAGTWAPNPPTPFGSLPHRLSIATNMNNSQPTAYSRPQQTRRNICDACKSLTLSEGPSSSGFHDMPSIIRQIANIGLLPPTANDIRDICETEGNENNGGGYFEIMSNDDPNLVRVRFVDIGVVQGGVGAVGVVGSPIQSSARPFLGLGCDWYRKEGDL